MGHRDYVLCEVVDHLSRAHEIESASGRTVEVIADDLVVGALGVRSATLEAVGDWRAVGDDLRLHALTRAAVLGDFDDRVIVESFDGRPSSTIQGMSLSTYDEDASVWRCWVDSRGRFTVVCGGFDGEAMDLRTEGEPLKRARWRDISDDGFTWTLEESADRGRTWELVWELRYTRVL